MRSIYRVVLYPLHRAPTVDGVISEDESLSCVEDAFRGSEGIIDGVLGQDDSAHVFRGCESSGFDFFDFISLNLEVANGRAASKGILGDFTDSVILD